MPSLLTLCLLALMGTQLYCHADQETADSKLANKRYVYYRDFGAKGDGKTDDFQAIVKAHAFANKHQRKVVAGKGLTFYLGGSDTSAIIRTDTDLRGAHFIIDDTAVENRRSNIFIVPATSSAIVLKNLKSLKKGQAKIAPPTNQPCLVEVTNAHTKHYIRSGANQNSGASQTDVFLVDQYGKVDKHTPILWNFDSVTQAKAYPIDTQTLTILGGTFTTIANHAKSKYTYYSRGISIQRSNVVIDGISHRIKNEGHQGAPYHGFLNITRCAKVKVKNAKFSGHKTYRTIGSAGRPVSMGTYDLLISKSINVSFSHCSQINDIHDRSLWGIMASNYCKNLLYDHCTLSRFDAHKGVFNAYIKNSTLGHAGITVIGHGTLLIENTSIMSRQSFVNFRSDYGSTWDGECVIRHCKFQPIATKNVAIFSGSNSGQHDFGYPCSMPKRITIESLHIHDPKSSKNPPTLFSNFNPHYKNPNYREKFPYAKTKRVTLKDVTTTSGKKLRVSNNPSLFRNVQVIWDPPH
ncbi:hypothetical protein [Rubritalea tangerina]|uniref:Pectate lyase superfamily protein domain-containing protein n=1 Tax=Rubritalea tangerina TaxID=430798 RepID=A0ABW4ZEB8_9BACT